MHVDDNIPLLRAICNQPDDDDVRLVYADWLDDHGDEARAEFVRMQCSEKVELSPRWLLDADRHRRYPFSPPPDIIEPPQLTRQLQLYTRHVRKWNGAIHRRLRHTPLHQQIDSRRGLVRGWSYRRGFPCTLWCVPKAVIEHAQAVFSIGPIERLTLLGTLQTEELVNVLQNLESYNLQILDVGATWPNARHLELLRNRQRFPCLNRIRVDAWPYYQSAG